MRARLNYRSLLLTYVATSLILVLIPLVIVGVFWYHDASSRVFDDILDMNRERLDRTVAETERIFRDLRHTAVLMSVEPKLRYRFVRENPINALEAIEILGYFRMRVPAVSRIILRYRGDTAIYTSEARFNESYFVDHELQVDPGQSWRVLQLLRATDQPKIETGIRIGVLRGEADQALLYVHPLTLGPFAGVIGTVAFLITETSFRDRLMRVAGPLDGVLHITDASGSLVFRWDERDVPHSGPSEAGAPELPGGGAVLSAGSTHPPVNYRLYISEPAFVERLGGLRRTLLLVVAAGIGFGFILAIVIAYRNYRPIGRLAALVAPDAQNRSSYSARNELDWISAAFSDALERLDEAISEATSHQTLVLQSLLGAALKRSPNGQQLDELERLALPREFDAGTVVVVSLPSTGRRGFISDRERFLDMTAAYRHARWRLYPVELIQRDDIAVIAISSQSDGLHVVDDALQQEAGCQLLQACESVGIAANVAVGSICYDWADVHTAFLDALSALNRLPFGADQSCAVYRADEADNVDSGVWFPARPLDRLRRSIESGSGSLVRQSADELMRAISARPLPPIMEQSICQYVATNVSSYILQLSDQKTSTPQLHALLACRGFDELNECLGALIDGLGPDSSSSSPADSDMVDAVRQTVADRYLDPNFTLLSLADEYKVSVYYMSRFYQRSLGVKFSEHLQTLRLREAERLLLCTNMTIAEISNAVCYQNSSHSIRFFKKATGTTPAAHRARARTAATPRYRAIDGN